ncbi:MAG: (d)CMP kinase [Arenicella sp.]
MINSAIDVPVLALDGPSGSGKGTIGQYCAHELGWSYLDSGAIYRALAWLSLQENVRTDIEQELVDLADRLQLICHVRIGDVAQIEVNGQFVTEELRTEEIASVASKIAPYAKVRAALLQLQREFRQSPGLVADGRDMGTTVFPDASYKVFLTASAEVRAQRRFDQLQQKGFNVSIARLLESIQERDARDSGRSASPLLPADDAIIIDTSALSIEQVNAQILGLIKNC